MLRKAGEQHRGVTYRRASTTYEHVHHAWMRRHPYRCWSAGGSFRFGTRPPDRRTSCRRRAMPRRRGRLRPRHHRAARGRRYQQAFVDSLRSQLGGRSVGVYAVNYPASNNFSSSTPAGGDDMSAHVQAMAASCPDTRMVLGGYSQGAAVVDLATTSMPADVSDNVAAAAEFGGARSAFADSLSAGPLPSVGPLYVGKTIEMCVPNDPICSQDGWDWRAHGAYVQTGMVNDAAAFAANRI
jgi:cutinase